MVEAVARARAEGLGRGGGRRGFSVVGCLGVSLLLSIAVEWAGMTWWWPEEGAAHARAVLEREQGYLNRDFVAVAGVAQRWAGAAYYWLFEWGGIDRALLWAARRAGVDQYVVAGLTVVQVIATRVVLVLLSLPAFVLFGVVGVTGGLTLRDIRRWSAGREFGAIYHAAKRLAPKALALAAVVYLAIPVAVHPSAVIVPGAVLFGLLALVVAASFKKYL